MYAAYDALSAPMKTFLDGLTAVHDGEHVYRGRYTHQVGDDAGRAYPKAVHPVIRTHPVTRRKAVFVNSFFTTRIPELSKNERSEERRVGQECVRTRRSRWSPSH